MKFIDTKINIFYDWKYYQLKFTLLDLITLSYLKSKTEKLKKNNCTTIEYLKYEGAEKLSFKK